MAFFSNTGPALVLVSLPGWPRRLAASAFAQAGCPFVFVCCHAPIPLPAATWRPPALEQRVLTADDASCAGAMVFTAYGSALSRNATDEGALEKMVRAPPHFAIEACVLRC